MVVVKVLDFGVSKNLSTEEAMATVTGQVVGSPAYMSPEQIRAARDIDLRSDVWSLGVVLFEMLSGRRPFQGGAQEVIAKILSGNVPRISKFVRNIDPTLDALIANCLQTDRDRRMSSAADLAKILNGFVSSRNDMLLLTSEPSNYTTASPQTTTGTLIPTAPVNVGRTSIESESKRRTSTSAEHAVPPDHARDNASSDPTRGPYVQGGTVKIPLEDLRHRAPSTLPEKKKDGDSTAQPFSTLSATLDSRKNFETASLLALWKELPRRLRITLVIAAISVTFIVLGLCAYAIILIKTKK
jgi:serine/threonine protein kinase